MIRRGRGVGRGLGLVDEVRGLDDGVGVERDGVDAALDEEAGELGVVGGRLAADADLLAGAAGGVDGEIKFYSISWYRPRPLIARTVEWISPQIVMLRDVEAEHLAGGRGMGHAVLDSLKFRTGFTHMEWFRKANGEVVFGEIAARPPGARSVDVMNYACDIDLFDGWAEAPTNPSVKAEG